MTSFKMERKVRRQRHRSNNAFSCAAHNNDSNDSDCKKFNRRGCSRLILNVILSSVVIVISMMMKMVPVEASSINHIGDNGDMRRSNCLTAFVSSPFQSQKRQHENMISLSSEDQELGITTRITARTEGSLPQRYRSRRRWQSQIQKSMRKRRSRINGSSGTNTRNQRTSLFCQLLGMNCASPTSFSLQWPDFCERGGNTDIHSDGWGLSYYDVSAPSSATDGGGGGLRQFHDTEPAATSQLADFLAHQPLLTKNLLAHIRYATSGVVDLANVHPFAREMWASNWCFCHNGQVPLFDDHPDFILDNQGDDDDDTSSSSRFYYPIGQTDSEATFCAILNALRVEFAETMPSLPILYDKISELCDEIVQYDPEGTILNFLLTCGPHVLWVYSWPGARPGSKVWNGLHYSVRNPDQAVRVADDDLSVDISSPQMFNHGAVDTTVCIVATKPLTDDEEWIELERGELILLDNGVPHVTPSELFRVELDGHGLHSAAATETTTGLKPSRLEEDMRRYAFSPDFFTGGGI